MARNKILIAEELHITETNVKESLDRVTHGKFLNFTKRFKQYKNIIVGLVDDKYYIIDGQKYFNLLLSIGIKQIQCYDLGKMTINELKIYRLLLNIHDTRLDYINIAEIVNKISENKTDLQRISNKTGISIIDLERYQQLLKFDWDEFSKEEINKQFNPFETYEE